MPCCSGADKIGVEQCFCWRSYQENETDIKKSIGPYVPHIKFVYILWCSRKYSVNDRENVFVIDRSNMIDYWSRRIKEYVKKEELEAYGYNPKRPKRLEYKFTLTEEIYIITIGELKVKKTRCLILKNSAF